MKNIVIVASIKVKEAFKDEVYNELLKLHKATHEFDEGCIQYDLHKDLSDENSFTFVETWKNAEFLSKHEEKEYFKTFVSNIDGKIENLNIQKLEKLDI
ncbi:putative quinol monooxygenase [Aliarcobacter butzleri]|uniref:Quinol monooxygenase n=1 Tax=Aliarcobacter butzleri TaxID=28197 RepID=A0AAW6VE80_9BACT|nr:putative quinol monooxygenase [Aliarcobacter butzleri]MDK2040812.1 putative quinol monooxygenase [Aliarcobacter butzleri]MDK2095650.1 putative quinol monooxygenase [Aliarcobacter butzleri]MDN5099297.1 putative quinol monooxygenase [Aliarcobacter butzleri]QDM01213.1 antibiotic biosynthesis monooxygenase [Aliarcobacter butzleri]